MMFSKACEYGIRAMLFVIIKSQNNERTRTKEIAEEIEAPKAFTAKVLQKLVKQDILHSSTGPKGGFYVEKEEIQSIKLIQIVRAIDGNGLFEECGIGMKACDESKPCPVHEEFKKIRTNLEEMLSTMSVGEMADKVDDELAFLKR